jgi:rod shape determining protein RodA
MALRRAPEPARRWDWGLLAVVLLLCAAGLTLVHAATAAKPALAFFPWRQALWMAMGLAGLGLAARLDHQGVVSLGGLFYGLVCLLLVVLLLTAQQSTYGAARWFDLGLFYMQPTELAKLALILALARYLSARQKALRDFSALLPALGMAGLMMALILRQPSLGTALVMLPITFSMLLVAGARIWHLGALLAVFAAAVPLAWPFLKDYQRNRFLAFLNPEQDALGSGYNAIQNQIAVGSGGWTGQGYLQGTQSQLHFVPFQHTDFIFAVLAEEWGLAGCTAVLLLLLALFARVAGIAVKARSMSGTLLCVGVLAWLGTQTVINIGMTVGLLPVTGMTLPLLSYGGSSTIMVLVSLGLVLSVRRDSLGA